MPRLLHLLPILLPLLIHFHAHHHHVVSVVAYDDVAPPHDDNDDNEPMVGEEDDTIIIRDSHEHDEPEAIENLLTNLEHLLQGIDGQDVPSVSVDDVVQDDNIHDEVDDDEQEVSVESDASAAATNFQDEHLQNDGPDISVNHDDNNDFILNINEEATMSDNTRIVMDYLENLLIGHNDHPDNDQIQNLLTNLEQILQTIETDEEVTTTLDGVKRVMDDLDKLIREVEEMEAVAVEEGEVADGDGIVVSDDDEIEGEEINGEENDEKERNDWKGLQIWRDEAEFIKALSGGRLLLTIITAAWCDKSHTMIERASRAAELLDDFFTKDDILEDLKLDPSLNIAKPLIGILTSESVSKSLIDGLGGITSFPAIKCVLTFSNDGDASSDEDAEEDMVMWDYIGQQDTEYDLYESILMYWYRFVVSNALVGHRQHTAGLARTPVFSFESVDELESFLVRHGERVLYPAHGAIRHQAKDALLPEMVDFYMGGRHRGFSGVLPMVGWDDIGKRQQQCTKPQQTNEQSDSIIEVTHEVDPYILLLQCRTNSIQNEDLTKTEVLARNEFDDLAEEMTHRKDVAFFSLIDEPVCDQWLTGAESKNGAVAVFRVRRFITYSIIDDNKEAEMDEESTYFPSHYKTTRKIFEITTKWKDALQNQPHAIYDPFKNIDNKLQSDGKKMKLNIVNDPMEADDFVRSNMVPFVVTQTTPTVLWFDRYRTMQLAFPWYRKIHSVLVVDIGLSHQKLQHSSTEPSHEKASYGADFIEEPQWPSKLDRSLAAAQLLSDQQKAIHLFYNAALHHRTKFPNKDVVFLIVPSSETRILTKFGIDIWTPLDEALFPSDSAANSNGHEQSKETGYCSSGIMNHGVLPAMVLTDDSFRSGKQMSRYYLCSDDMLATSSTSLYNGGAITELIGSFFGDTLGKPFIRSDDPQPSNLHNTPWQSNKNKANVTILTGNSFESLVMERKESHSMLLFQTITCGHCKRFSILWNEFSSLVQAMNWGDIIEVMKIDVSKNDVLHSKVDVWDVPSVYYFPAGEKENPIEVTWVGPERNPQYDYEEGLSWIRTGSDLVEWIIRQGKLDIELLIRLDESKNKPPL